LKRREALQHQLLQAQLRDQTRQLRVLLLEFLQPSRLIHLQPAAVANLLDDLTFLARLRQSLVVRQIHLNLPQQAHDPFRAMHGPTSISIELSVRFRALLQSYKKISRIDSTESRPILNHH
jgi:hypothetical protein